MLNQSQPHKQQNNTKSIRSEIFDSNSPSKIKRKPLNSEINQIKSKDILNTKSNKQLGQVLDRQNSAHSMISNITQQSSKSLRDSLNDMSHGNYYSELDEQLNEIRGIIDSNIDSKYNVHQTHHTNPFKPSDSLNCSNIDINPYFSKSKGRDQSKIYNQSLIEPTKERSNVKRKDKNLSLFDLENTAQFKNRNANNHQQSSHKQLNKNKSMQSQYKNNNLGLNVRRQPQQYDIKSTEERE